MPVCHRSWATLHFPLSGSCSHLGFPRRVTSIPSTATAGNGSVRAGTTWTVYARWATGQDIR